MFLLPWDVCQPAGGAVGAVFSGARKMYCFLLRGEVFGEVFGCNWWFSTQYGCNLDVIGIWMYMQVIRLHHVY